MVNEPSVEIWSLGWAVSAALTVAALAEMDTPTTRLNMIMDDPKAKAGVTFWSSILGTIAVPITPVNPFRYRKSTHCGWQLRQCRISPLFEVAIDPRWGLHTQATFEVAPVWWSDRELGR